MPNMTLKIDTQDWQEYKDHFLLIHPNQTKDSFSVLSDDDWVFYRIFLFARGSYEKGIRQVFDQQALPPINPAIISITT